MAKVVFIAPEVPGHINAALALAKQCQKLGVNCQFWGVEEARPRVEGIGISFRDIHEGKPRKSSLKDVMLDVGRRVGIMAIWRTQIHFRERNRLILRDMPGLINHEQPDLMVIDQTIPGAAAIAQQFSIPYVNFCGALPMDLDPWVPPPVFHCAYSTSSIGLLRNKVLNFITNLGWFAIIKDINQERKKAGFRLVKHFNDLKSPIAMLTQLPPQFDFKRKFKQNYVYHLGPLVDPESRLPVDFPWNQLDPNKKLVYASMGTLQNQISSVFEKIAEAVSDLDCQLVISLGGGGLKLPNKLQGNPIVVEKAPQLALLEKADVVITHAGMNTAMECLKYGKPMVCIPVTNDQPGVAARIVHQEAGFSIPVQKLTPHKLKKYMQILLEDHSYTSRSDFFAGKLILAGGAEKGAQIIQQVLQTVLVHGQTTEIHS
ncbi:MAG: hypothetical protein MK193_07195 [Lentisphaeria bacterium]|nr:hypothetical protein [Lentisphaeria bacterium]